MLTKNNMFDYLQKFNKLPQELKEKVSNPGVMKNIAILENKYGINLAPVVMKIMIKDIDVKNLNLYFSSEFRLTAEKANFLVKELTEQVFFDCLDYLGLKEDNRKNIEAEKVIVSKEIKDNKGEIVNNSKSEESVETKEDNFFSEDDEKEIKELTENANKLKELSEKNDFETELAQIIAKAKISFSSGQLADRFKAILRTYLRGVRNKIETKQTLAKAFEEGGLGLKPEAIDKIFLITDSVVKNIKEKNNKVIKSETKPEKKDLFNLEQTVARDVSYDLSALPQRKEELKKLEEKNEKKNYFPINQEKKLAPPPPSISNKKTNVETQNLASKNIVSNKNTNEIIKKEIQTTKPTPSPEENIVKKIEKKPQIIKAKQEKPKIKIFPQNEMDGKKRMDDIKYVPKVMSPLDELLHLNLLSFRRIDSDPVKIMKKIKSKIKLLEEEDYQKRFQGIQAWRRNKINELYLKIGQESISENQPIDAIIEKRKKNKEDYLTIEEFNAIMDFNKHIRF